MKVTISRDARRDLAEIADYVGQDNPRAAVRYVGLIERQCLDLRRMPRRFPVIWWLTHEVRQRVVGRHYIFAPCMRTG